jgi:hypothetical protein
MGYVLYVGFATHRRATVRIHLHFKRLMFKQMICIYIYIYIYIYIKKGRHTASPLASLIGLVHALTISGWAMALIPFVTTHPQ